MICRSVKASSWARTPAGSVNQVIGNWQLATIGYLHTGQWLTPQNTSTGNPYLPNLQMVRNPILSGSQQKVINFQGTNQLLYFAGNFDTTGTGLANYQPALIIPGPNQDGYVPVQLQNGTTVNVPYDVYNSMGQNFIQGPKQLGNGCLAVQDLQVHRNEGTPFHRGRLQCPQPSQRSESELDDRFDRSEPVGE